MRQSSLAMAALLGLLPGTARAGGFVLYEFGAQGTGMCGAQTARGDDPSALFFNPAAITRLEGTQGMVGVSLIKPISSYTAGGSLRQGKKFSVHFAPDGETRDVYVSDGTHSVDQEDSLFYPPFLYLTHRVTDGVTVGFGFTTPYGLGVNWPRDWDGRYMVKQVNLETYVLNPNVAVDLGTLLGAKIGDTDLHVSLAVGYMGIYSKALVDKNIDFRAMTAYVYAEPYPEDEADLDGSVEMTGDAWANSFNVAMHVELPKVLSFGASYRHGFTLDYEGNAKFTIPQWVSPILTTLGKSFPDTTGSVSMNMPALYGFGLALLAVEDLTVEADLFLEDWRDYDELKFHWGCNDDENPCGIPEEAMVKDWQWNYQVSLGAQYDFGDGIAARLGVGRVGTPVPEETYDPMLPDGERTLLTAGFGMPITDAFRFDVGYMLAMWEGEKTGETRTVVTDDGKETVEYVNDVGGQDVSAENGRAIGTYETTSHILSMGLTARF